jgi:cation transport ATPase
MGVLTAGSPCAVVLVPLAYVCAIATITRKGVLVRSGAALDALITCTTVALDKTGASWPSSAFVPAHTLDMAGARPLP